MLLDEFVSGGMYPYYDGVLVSPQLNSYWLLTVSFRKN